MSKKSVNRRVNTLWIECQTAPRIQHGAMALHGFRNHTGKTSDAHQGRARGGDQAPLAAIAWVSAAKSETWSLVFCLRM